MFVLDRRRLSTYTDDAKEFVSPLLSKEGGELKTNAKVKDFAIADKAPVGKNDYALSDTIVMGQSGQ